MPACAVAEYPSVRAFALSPGVVRTRMYVEAGVGAALNTVELPAATTLYLTSGRADWLSGRYVDRPRSVYIKNSHACAAIRYFSTNWDIAEVERDWKDAILEQKALVNKLCVPIL
jgi:hypothetical protein